jgi:hypothetical protein
MNPPWSGPSPDRPGPATVPRHTDESTPGAGFVPRQSPVGPKTTLATPPADHVDVARAFGARVTPDVFVFDAERFLAYRGAPDADWEDPSLNAAWLRGAIDDLIDSGPVSLVETEPVGCSIKCWL